jgi:peroxiredoxin Q/BCP
MSEFREGDFAPDFTLPADDGTPVRLTDLRGRWVVLYFYPKANTPGCTQEACEFRDGHAEAAARGAVVLGISPDPVSALARFRTKYALPFRLLSDADHRVAEAYGVWKEKTLYGRKTWGVERSTFLIDPEGRIARIWRRVQPAGHAAEVLAALPAA